MSTHAFYQQLPVIKKPLSEILAEPGSFHEIPEDWDVFVTDVVASTKAVQEGKDREVNMCAAGTIICALNLAQKNSIEIASIFNGDGTLILCPRAISEMLYQGLGAHRANCRKYFGLDIRVGRVSIKEITERGHDIKVAKVHFTEKFPQAVLIGTGPSVAEQWLKEDDRYHVKGDGDELFADISGLECRWDKILPPAKEKEIISLIVLAKNENEQEVFGEIMEKIDEIYGDLKQRHPVKPDKLSLLVSLRNIRKENQMNRGSSFTLFSKCFRTFLGVMYFRFNWKTQGIRGKAYKEQLVLATDVLKIDGTIKTVMAGTIDQRIRLLDYLNMQESNGKILYGYFISPASIITCYVRSLKDDHLHFLDGLGGGYTRASYELKSKMVNV